MHALMSDSEDFNIHSDYKKTLKKFIQTKQLPQDLADNILKFCISYDEALKSRGKATNENLHLLVTFIQLVVEELQNPYSFEPFHQRITSPFDYYQFGLNLMKALIDFDRSSVLNLDAVGKMNEQINKNENVILFANHQIEPDPQVIHLMLEDKFPLLAKKMIFVAGHRVTTDPLAIPFSKGCNLLCIYSKKHLENPPEQKVEKQLHNQRTMKKMQVLLEEGGKCIYVAPSGGRDRINAEGIIEVANFDPQSIEMFRFIAQQAKTATHFYPLALSTYHLLPPPTNVEKTIGERRHAQCTPVHLCFGDEIEMEEFPGKDPQDKRKNRDLRAEFIYNIVKNDYKKLER